MIYSLCLLQGLDKKHKKTVHSETADSDQRTKER